MRLKVKVVEHEVVEFCLNNGTIFSYSITPDRDLIGQIQDIFLKYYKLSTVRLEKIYVTPAIMSALQEPSYYCVYNLPYSSIGSQMSIMMTAVRSVEIHLFPKLECQILIGTMEEYKNDNFNKLLNEVLST